VTSSKAPKPLDGQKKLQRKINWNKVDFDAIQIPEPKNPEPQLHYENGKTYHKHPNRHASLVYFILF
jgi:hypothetical protein